MSENGDDEIEYLDEDAEIVQQCVQTAQTVDAQPNYSIETELLVERLPNDARPKKKKRVEEDDFDYDPGEDLRRSRVKQRKLHSPSDHKKGSTPQSSKVKKDSEKSVDLKQRRQMDVRLPDYEDPLCLPVRAVIRDRDDDSKRKNWNALCLEKFRQLDRPMRVDKEETVASKRIVELHNMRNNSGKIDTAIFSKIIVQDKTGSKKADSFRSILPRYREKKVLTNYRLLKNIRKHPLVQKTELILQQEKNDEALVIYNTDECAAFEYKMFDKEGKDKEDDRKLYLKETACRKMCSSCYHSKHRGYEKVDPNNYCHVCKRVFLNSKILMSHLKTHSSSERALFHLKQNRESIKRTNDNYKCMICQRKFMGIMALKKHVVLHTGSTTPFVCEVGKHMVR